MSQSSLNYPRVRVTVNGIVLDGVSRVSVTQGNAFQIAKFCFVKGFVPGDVFPANWWAATENKTILVTIELSVDGVTFIPVITGNADSHLYDAISNVISVNGRDLASSMIDTRITTTYRNLTASEIASALAAKHGLQTSITPTATIVGRVYDVDHDETSCGDFSRITNEWDLLCQLGEAEGVIPYVLGSTLYFNPPSPTPQVFPVTLTRNADGLLVSDVTGLALERHMTFARDVVVEVRSWNSRSKTTVTSIVRTRTRDGSAGTALKPTTYLYEIPNLTQAQCLLKAQQLALDISQHERYARIVISSLALMDPQTVIPISGTGTDYDGTYFPLTVSYELTTECGAITVVEAKMPSPLSIIDDDTGQLLEGAQ